VWEEVELLKDHTSLFADSFNIFDIPGQFDSIHDDLAALVFFQAVDRSDESRFSRA
jgi:hypothetical protein